LKNLANPAAIVRAAKKVNDLQSLPARSARGAIRLYQLTLSSLVGRQCRHLPTCSAYMDEAIGHYGLWAGGWIGLARLCRCHPFGASGYDPVPAKLPPQADPLHPWRYGSWRAIPVCEAVEPNAKD
jgi:putative membrane protein insertion efficiency factor